jgi:hypothetical protein
MRGGAGFADLSGLRRGGGRSQLGVEQALGLIQRSARGWVETQLRNRSGELRIPVSARGTLFVHLPVLGRVGVGYGPVRSAWRVL